MHANRKLTEEQVTELLARVRDGEPYTTIARALGVSDTRVYQLAKRHGIHVPKRRPRAAAAGAQG